MIISPKNSKMRFVIPDGYQLLKNKNPVKKLANSFDGRTVYQKTTAECNGIFMVWKTAVDEAMHFDDLPGLIDGINETLSENQGLIAANAGFTKRQNRYIYSIVKNRDQDGIPGISYVLRINIASETEIIEINGVFIEIGTTGMRDAIGYELAQKGKLVAYSEKENSIIGWNEDPYDASYTIGNLMNLSEKEGLDGLFPDHPLSQARELLHALLFDELMLPPGNHDGGTGEKDESVLSDEEAIALLFSKESKRKFSPEKIDVSDIKNRSKSRFGKKSTVKDNHQPGTEGTDKEQCKGEETKFPFLFKKDVQEEVDDGIATKSELPQKKISLDVKITQAISTYNDVYTILNDKGTSLYYERIRSLDVMELVEYLVNSVANQPKSFEADFGEIHVYQKRFTDAREIAEKELKNARNTATMVGSGVAAGAAVASIAPTAAVWIATTFGTASTGTAISTLSGAAAQSAALAWLGGGALAAGGGGMAAGNALLALAGPLGWGVAGVSVLASVVLFANNKIKTNKEKNNELVQIKSNTEQIQETLEEISQLMCKTENLRINLMQQYRGCLSLLSADYQKLSKEEKLKLGALVNNTKSLAALLEITVSQEDSEV